MREMRTRLASYLKQSPRTVAVRLLKGALQPWVEWGTLVFLEQDLETTPAVPDSAGHEIRELSSADLPALISFQGDQADLARRLARGDRAFAFFEAGSGVPLHVRWGTTSPTWIPEVGLWLHPRPREFYLYDVMTHSLHRGQRLAALVGAAMDETFRKQGFRKKVGYVRADNPAMMRSMEWASVPLRRLFQISYLRWADREPLVLGSPRPPLCSKPNDGVS
jgi:RimJ/RimL family protein N-acetyltransferase